MTEPREKPQGKKTPNTQKHGDWIACYQTMNVSRMRLGKKSVSGNKQKWTHNNPKPMGHRKGSPEREVHRNTGLPKKNRNITNKQSNPTSTRTRGTTTKTMQSNSKEANNQDKSRIKWHRE